MRYKDDTSRIEALSQSDEAAFRSLYVEWYEGCCHWVERHFSVSRAVFEDIYQEAMIALLEAARDGKLHGLSCSLKTYLFAICRNKLLDQFKLQKRRDEKVEEVATYQREWLDVDIGEDERISKVVEALNKLKEPCRTIVTLDYYHNMDNASIAAKLNYESKEVVKVQKSRCMNYLRKLIWNQ